MDETQPLRLCLAAMQPSKTDLKTAKHHVDQHTAHRKPRIIRLALIGCGLLCLALGVIGIFLPLLPTTIFLLAAAACFIRSSEPLHHWLIQHRIFGTYIRFAQGKSGIPMRAKIVTLAVLWATILYSAFWFSPFWWLRVLLLAIAVAVSVFILTRPTLYTVEGTAPCPGTDACAEDISCPECH